MSEEITAAVEAVINSYRAAFSRYDPDAIVEYFALPNVFVSDGDPVALIANATPDDCRVGVERVLAWHRSVGMADGKMIEFSVTELSDQLAVAHLNVELQDAQGSRLYDFQGVYTLAKIAGRWRIAAIAHNQIPRLRACVDRMTATQGPAAKP